MPGQRGPEPVVQVAAQAAALLLARGDDLTARDLELRRERDRVERERELGAQYLGEREIAGAYGSPGARAPSTTRPSDWPRWRSSRSSAGSAGALADADRSEAEPGVGLEHHARGAERLRRRAGEAGQRLARIAFASNSRLIRATAVETSWWP